MELRIVLGSDILVFPAFFAPDSSRFVPMKPP
jgi:hypothetical protein